MTSESGRVIKAFMGIPFARPPVGNLRFRAPQKVEPWNVTLLTQNEHPKCPQIDTFFGGATPIVEGEENCLFLNVYVPETTTSEPLDVLVWIHGGAFVVGTAGVSSYGPDYLLDHDVIMVAGNYRLGMLGFLSTEDRFSPGNFGLKDQAFLLQWVQENIHHFGGNNDSVTIWGESAGGVSVHYQMISPMSRGLFHKAILNSGTLNNGWCDPARTGVARQQAFNLAEHVGCWTNETTTEEIVECLRGMPIQDILSYSASAPYPVVENFETDEDAFIGERNFDDLHSNSVEIPMLLGMNTEEGLLNIATHLSNSLALDNIITNWDQTLANSFGFGDLSESEREAVTNKLNAFYFGREATPTNELDRNHLVDLFTDGGFIGIVETIRHRLSYTNHNNTYVYLYTQKGTASFSTATEFFGTSHADDLIPLFPMRKVAFYSTIPSEHDRELTRLMTLMWTNFVKTGNPTPDGTATPIWPLATHFPLDYLQIGIENGKFDSQILQPRVDYHSHRANFRMELRDEHRISSWLHDSSSSAGRYSLSLVGLLLTIMCIHFI
ncbi:hypothetical protein HA402_005406 [Bradysia odoriphaga]|nr:hypothetical protein HA402_005406 [Bradysia odoriphaga]